MSAAQFNEDVAIAKSQIIMWSVGFIGAAVGAIVAIETLMSAAEAWNSAAEVSEGVEAVIGVLGLTLVAGGLPVIGVLFARHLVGWLAMLIWAPVALYLLGAPLWAIVDAPTPTVAEAPKPAPATPATPAVVKVVPYGTIKIVETELSNAIAMIDPEEWEDTNQCKSTFRSAACERVKTLRNELATLKDAASPKSATQTRPAEVKLPKPRTMGSVLLLRLTQLLGPGFCVACLMSALTAVQAENAAFAAAAAAPKAPETPLNAAPPTADPRKELKAWTVQNVHPDAASVVSFEDLFRNYVAWCARTGSKQLAPQDFVDGAAEALMYIRGASIDHHGGFCHGVRLGV